MKKTWNLKLLYSSPKDPHIEKDVRSIEGACQRFAHTYRKRTDYLTDAGKLYTALRVYERLYEETAGSKPLMYFWYVKEVDSSNAYAEAMINKITDRLTKAHNKILFFDLSLGRIDIKKQKQFLKSKKLAKYRYFLKKVFEESKYDLTEKEEKVLNLKSMPSHSLWVSGVEKALNAKQVSFKGKDIPIAEAMNKVSTLTSVKERRVLSNNVMKSLYSMSDFSESEMNAVYIDKKIDDELRGFKKPYSATILGYGNSEKSVLNLVGSVSNSFSLSRRFYTLKKKLLKLDHLEYADRIAHAGSIRKTIPFAEALDIVRTVFYGVDTKYGEILDSFVQRGQIDVYSEKGKSSGAFCSGSIGLPTFVLLNHVNDINSVLTLGHEMGHAVHTERSKEERPLYQHYSIATAETASTFFETLVFEHIFSSLSEKEQVVALHDKIQEDIQTIFRQIAFFNFELELHNLIRSRGSLPKEEIAVLLNKHMKAYLGPAFKLHEKDGYFFVAVSHFRRFFYVYSYAYGQLVSKELYRRYKEDNGFSANIDQFLTSGGNDSPENIFKHIGVDTTRKGFFESGLAEIESDIRKLEKRI